MLMETANAPQMMSLSEPSTSLASLGGELDGYQLAIRDGPAELVLRAELQQLLANGVHWQDKDNDWLQVLHAE